MLCIFLQYICQMEMSGKNVRIFNCSSIQMLSFCVTLVLLEMAKQLCFSFKVSLCPQGVNNLVMHVLGKEAHLWEAKAMNQLVCI